MANPTNIERLKLELNNQNYFTDEEYMIFLIENNLTPESTYDKSSDQINLLRTALSILETLTNDVDMYRRVQSEFQTTGQSMQYFRRRIADLKLKIQQLEAEDNSPFTLLYTRSRGH